MYFFFQLNSGLTKKLHFGYKVVLWMLLLFMMGDIQAQSVSRVGTTAAGFLKIGVGGRALAMGEAVTTQVRDVTALYWNPAGLVYLKNTQVLLNHYDYIADLNFDYVGLAIPVSQLGVMGIHFSYLGMPDIERTTVNEPLGNGEKVSASSYSFGFTFARFLTDRFSIGGTGKYIRENIWHCHASGFAADLGVYYRAFFKDIKIGMTVSNFGTTMQLDGRDLLVQHDIDELSNGNNSNINANLSTDKFSLPILFRVGISSNIPEDFFGIQNHDLVLAADAVHPNDNFEYMNVGAEYCYHNLISFRYGYRQLFLKDVEGGMTFGFGLNLNLMKVNFNLDYAAVDLGRLDYLNKFSLIFGF